MLGIFIIRLVLLCPFVFWEYDGMADSDWGRMLGWVSGWKSLKTRGSTMLDLGL